MKNLNQNDMDWIMGKVEKGELTVAEANVEIVRTKGIQVLENGRLPKDVRKALNDAVKAGKLKHFKKDGVKPEVYCHPNSEMYVNSVRNKYVEAAARALLAICSPGTLDY